MKTGKNKVSVRQLLFVYTIMVSSPATRFLTKSSAARAAQAGWISPVLCIIPFTALIWMIDSLVKKYGNKSMAEIISIILGRYLGFAVNTAYLLWALWLTAMYTRYYAIRLTNSIYPNINDNILIILTLIPIAYMLRSGLTVIARMSEVLLPFIGAMLVMLSIFLLGKVRLDNVLPVYFNDIIPVFNASLGLTSILCYLFLMFFLGDRLVNLKSLKSFGYIALYVNISSLMLLTFITIGVMGSTVTERAPMPVLTAVKQISLMDTIENIEAIIVAIWIFADFTLISTLFIITLNIMKSMFKLSDTKPLINVLAILVYFMSMGISANKFEIEEFSNKLLMPLNISLGLLFPCILFILSKLKKGRNEKKQPILPGNK